MPQEQEGVPPAPDVTPDSVFVVLRLRRASVRRLVVVGEERGHQSGTEFSEIESTAGSFAFPRPFLPSYRFSFPPVHIPGQRNGVGRVSLGCTDLVFSVTFA